MKKDDKCYRVNIQCWLYTPFLAYFPHFEKNEKGLCDLHAVYVSVYPALSTFELMALNPSQGRVCIPLSLLGNGWIKVLPLQRIHTQQ
jgi:hypothetical protein